MLPATLEGVMMALSKGQKRIFWLVALVGVLFWMTNRQKQNKGDAVAWVNRRPVTREYFEQVMSRHSTGVSLEESKRLALGEVVERKALFSLALESGVFSSPAVQEMVEDILVAELRRKELESLNAWVPGADAVLAEYERVKASRFRAEGEDGGFLPLEQVRERVVEGLAEVKREAVLAAMTSNAVAAASVKVNEEVMAAIGTTPEPPVKAQP